MLYFILKFILKMTVMLYKKIKILLHSGLKPGK